MEIDSSPTSYAKRIVQRLSNLDIPDEILDQGQHGLVSFYKCHKCLIQDLAAAIIPDYEVGDVEELAEVMVWLQWLMFEEEPKFALEHLAKLSSDQRGVCGAVWGNNDIAYRCTTCEHDPTCAICVPCFENGNHKDHDYSIIYTSGGCCDCGDATAWKREGFCSKHKGSEQIQQLPKHISESLGPVLDVLLKYWKDNLAKVVSEEISGRRVGADAFLLKCAEDLTSVVVDMLLDFCKQSESLLSFISVRVYSTAGGLLDILLRAERCLADSVVEKLHELLLKMLGEPTFKYEFAKLFVLYYPSVVNAAIAEGGDDAFKKCPLLSNFSVQILTVPTLTPRLVQEINLLGVLLQCLETIFFSCAGEDGRLQVTKWANLYDTTLRVIEDVRFVMGHSAVPKYLCHRRRDLVRTWIRLLAFVQGMNTLKRETGNHIEEENDHVHLPFVLCHSISNILSLLVAGAFSKDLVCDNSEETLSSTYKSEVEDKDTLRHAKVGRLSEESSINCNLGKTEVDHDIEAAESLPSSALWLVYECLKSIENWLVVNNTSASLGPLSLKTSDGSNNNFHVLRRTLSRFRKNRYIFKSSASPDSSEYRQATGQAVPSNSDKNLVEGENNSELEGLIVLSSSSWPNIAYDISLQEISVHLPLHQLFSMMLRRFLKEFYSGNLMSSSPVCHSAEPSLSRDSDILRLILNGSHPYGFSAFLMEHPLRIRVFCAEVHSGIWRRNGDAPLVFSDWYRSVRWSEQGQELDLFLLQICSSLAPPDLFVQRILERFGLSNYLSLNLEQPSEHEPIMVTEMLTLLIQIVKERRFCGLTTEQCLVRELVYKLSLGDATRSNIVKSLPRDLSKVDELQKILDRVAAYSHPSGLTQGTYKLRASYWKELDLYHPRWSLRDQQAAVERYSRFCNVSALTAQIPRWSKIYHSLRGIAKIATCKTVVQIVRAVLFYAVSTDKSTASRAPDGVLLTALHLLALALDICRSHKESGDLLCDFGNDIPILVFATEEISTNKHGDQSMLSLLFLLMRMYEKENAQNLVESADFNLPTLILGLLQTFAELEPACAAKLLKLSPQLVSQFPHSTLTDDDTNASGLIGDNEMRKAKARERQAAMLEKMRNQQSKFLESFSGQNDEMDDVQFDKDTCGSEGLDDSLEQEVICSLCHEHIPDNPVSFLVLLQKSRLSSFVEQGPPSWDQVKGSSHACEDTVASSDACSGTACDCTGTFSWDQLEDLVQCAVNAFASTGLPAEVNSFVEFTKARFPSIKTSHLPCLSNNRVERLEPPFESVEESAYQLIEDSKSDLRGKFSTDENSKKRSSCSELLLLGKYIASLPKDPLDTPSASKKSDRITKRIKFGTSPLHPEYDYLGTSGIDGIYVSSCGHAVHQGCLDRYLASLRERHIRRIAFDGGPIVDPDQGEFLCPVCRGLANSVLPFLPPKMRKVPRLPTVSSSGTHADDFSTMSDHGCLLCLKEGLSLIEKTANFVSRNETINALPVENMKLANLETIIHLLCGIYYPGEGKVLGTGRISDSVILWHTLKYSLISTEIAARSKRGSLRPNYDPGALYREINSSTGFILSLILDLIQNTRTSYQDVLLRFHAIQLFAESLSCRTYTEDLRQEGDGMLCILENSESQVQYPDIQLWSLASQPVIAHDAFLSFMWILFCLPWPMLSCRKSYFSLVHVFYVASVIQAIIVSHKKRRSVEVGKSHGDLITEIYRVIGEHPEAGKYFESRFITDPASEVVDAIRSLSFPFLRRCALLWKLINGSRITPFSYGNNYPEKENRGSNYSYESYVGPDANVAISSSEEIQEVNELKNFFGIPSDDFIVNDETTKLTALSWLDDFIKVHGVGAYKCQNVLKCTPAVPFQLMTLPHLYQDLLQRYIKKSCPECGVVNEEPALCLLCGKLCSPNWKTCCRESGCLTHAASCGAGMGVFLLIRKTSVLLQRSARQAHWPSPYLDTYGEEDIEMRRGKPLFLNEERYAALTHMVASHGIDRSSEVLRQTTIGAFFMF